MRVVTKQEAWDNFFMDVADRASDMSYDEKTRVGCLVVRDGNILSFSYNGTPPGHSNIMRDADGETIDDVLHAETNALFKVARSTETTAASTVYTTRCPCLSCAKAIFQAGVVRVVYRGEHSDNRGHDFLRRAGVVIERI